MQIAVSSLSNRAVRSTFNAAVICRVSGVGAVKVANAEASTASFGDQENM